MIKFPVLKIRHLMILMIFISLILVLSIPAIRSPIFRDFCLTLGLDAESPEEAEAGIRRMGGIIQRHEAVINGPVAFIQLEGLDVNNPGLVHLKQLGSTEILILKNADIGNFGFNYVKHLKKLKILVFSNTWLTDDGLVHLEHLNQLEELDLSLNPGITDEGLEHLTHLPRIKMINLSNTGTTKPGILRLIKKLTNVVIIY